MMAVTSFMEAPRRSELGAARTGGLPRISAIKSKFKQRLARLERANA
jgi:hypothetical protein